MDPRDSIESKLKPIFFLNSKKFILRENFNNKKKSGKNYNKEYLNLIKLQKSKEEEE